MARPPRLQLANAIYHVVARGNERSPIYRDDADRERFLTLLGECGQRYGWRVLGYCLMTSHYHLLVQTPEPNLARGMRQLNGVYAQAFNRRHTRVGHVFQGRYGARLVQADEHLLATARYIARNPVRAGVCRRPGEWRWSHHRATVGLEPARFHDTEALLSHYAPTYATARRLYSEHAEDDRESEPPAHPLAVGDDPFVNSLVELLEPTAGIPHRYRHGTRPRLETLLQTRADEAALARARDHGYSLRQIARHLEISASTVSRRLQRLQPPTSTATKWT
jgi:REP element-mobilizing transposase RayT